MSSSSLADAHSSPSSLPRTGLKVSTDEVFEFANCGIDLRALGRAGLAVIEFVTGLCSRAKATSTFRGLLASFAARCRSVSAWRVGSPPGIPAFGRGLLGISQGGSHAVVVHSVNDPCFVLSSLSRLRAWLPRSCMAMFRVAIACWWVADAMARWCVAMEGRTPLQSAVCVVSKFLGVLVTK